LAAELNQTGARLDALDAGEPASQIRAVFASSYRALTPAAARLFRLLGLHPGPDVSVAACASLTALTPVGVRPLLVELVRTNLIDEHVPGRYSYHDLLRAYAAELADNVDAEQRHAAIHRLLDHYLHNSCAADRLLDPVREPIVLDAALPGVTVEQVSTREHAIDWFAAEHSVLLAAVRQRRGARLRRPRLAARLGTGRPSAVPRTLGELGRDADRSRGSGRANGCRPRPGTRPSHPRACPPPARPR
jgi:hypothetical protein